MTPKTLNQAQYANHRGVTRTTVTDWKKADLLVFAADGKVDVAATDARLHQQGVADKRNVNLVDAGVKQSGELNEAPAEAADRIVNLEGRAPYSKAEAERIKENYLALLRELEYDRESGAVVLIEDVALAVAAEYALIRNKLRGIGSKVAPRAAVMRSPEEVKALVDAEVAAAIGELTLDGHGHSDHSRLQRSLQEKFAKTA